MPRKPKNDGKQHVQNSDPLENEVLRQQLSKDLAEAQLRKLEAFEILSREQVVAQSKWLNASLLAVNSAGLIAAMQAAEASRDHLALISFGVGIGASLLSGAAIQETYLKVSPKRVSRAEPYWREVAITGARDPEIEDAIRKEREANTWSDILAPTLGYISGLAWIVGAVALAF